MGADRDAAPRVWRGAWGVLGGFHRGFDDVLLRVGHVFGAWTLGAVL